MNAKPRRLADFLSLRASSDLCGVRKNRIKEWAEAGIIGTRTLPGLDTKYSRADLEALMARSTTVGTLAHAG